MNNDLDTRCDISIVTFQTRGFDIFASLMISWLQSTRTAAVGKPAHYSNISWAYLLLLEGR